MTRSDLITSLADSGVTTNERGTAKSTYLLENQKRISPSKALITKSLPLQQDKLQHSQKKKAKPKRVCEGHLVLPGHFGYDGLATSERASASFKLREFNFRDRGLISILILKSQLGENSHFFQLPFVLQLSCIAPSAGNSFLLLFFFESNTFPFK